MKPDLIDEKLEIILQKFIQIEARINYKLTLRNDLLYK